VVRIKAEFLAAIILKYKFTEARCVAVTPEGDGNWVSRTNPNLVTGAPRWTRQRVLRQFGEEHFDPFKLHLLVAGGQAPWANPFKNRKLPAVLCFQTSSARHVPLKEADPVMQAQKAEGTSLLWRTPDKVTHTPACELWEWGLYPIMAINITRERCVRAIQTLDLNGIIYREPAPIATGAPCAPPPECLCANRRCGMGAQMPAGGSSGRRRPRRGCAGCAAAASTRTRAACCSAAAASTSFASRRTASCSASTTPSRGTACASCGTGAQRRRRCRRSGCQRARDALDERNKNSPRR